MALFNPLPEVREIAGTLALEAVISGIIFSKYCPAFN
jgi:hypothetical protein